MLLKPPAEALPPLQLESPAQLPCPALLEADAGAQEPLSKALTRGSCIAVQASSDSVGLPSNMPVMCVRNAMQDSQ